MATLHHLIDILLHLDTYMSWIISQCGAWTYILLFLIIFCETGILLMAFLPGDSLLFATGTLAALPSHPLNIHILFIALFIAAVSGNTLNYLTGHWIGPRIFNKRSRFLSQAHLLRTHDFCERHGGKAIIIASFMPILRTFTPFVVGVGYMRWQKFALYNLIGALLWIGGLLYCSYLFGNIPVIRNHFSFAILGIIAISLLPFLIGALQALFKRNSA